MTLTLHHAHKLHAGTILQTWASDILAVNMVLESRANGNAEVSHKAVGLIVAFTLENCNQLFQVP